jgi:hypothetical protein
MAKKRIYATTASMIRDRLSKHTFEYWADRYLIWAEQKMLDGKMPFLTQFFRTYDIIITGGIGRDIGKDYKKIQELYRIVSKEFVIGKNIDKASFASLYLQNAGEWDKDIKTDQRVSINLTSFKLPPAEPHKALETSTVDDNIIDATVVDSSFGDAEVVDDYDILEVVNPKDDIIVEIAKEVKKQKKEEGREQNIFDVNNKLTEMLDTLEKEKE